MQHINSSSGRVTVSLRLLAYIARHYFDTATHSQISGASQTKTLAASVACILVSAVLALSACSSDREELIEESARAPEDYSPKTEAILNEPDGQLGVPTEDTDQQADADQQADDTSVLNPSEMDENERNLAAKKEFVKLDASADGFLQPDEVEKHQQIKQRLGWEELDSDSNEKLDIAEFAKFETK